MEKNDYDKKRYTQMKILKQDMEIMKKEIEQLKDALKKKVETKVEQKVETPETPEETSSFIGKAERFIETPETLETPKVERHLHFGIDIDEMEIPKVERRVIHYKEVEYPPTKFTRHHTTRTSKTMKMWK